MKTCSIPFVGAVYAGRWLRIFIIALLALGFVSSVNPATVTIDGSQTFQTIDGFGVNLNHWNTNEIGPVIDALVDQAGMTLFRVIMDHADWEAANTNSNPSVTNWVVNWGYYNGVYSTTDFENLWDTIDYLNKKGLTNGISLSFMGAGPSWLIAPDSSGYTFLIPGYEPHWAEMLTSLVLYGRNTRHLQFHLIEPNNEPDNLSGLPKIRVTQGTQAVTALEDLAQCLDANGLSDVRFVGPDLDVTSTTWISDWLNDPMIMAKAVMITSSPGRCAGATRRCGRRSRFHRVRHMDGLHLFGRGRLELLGLVRDGRHERCSQNFHSPQRLLHPVANQQVRTSGRSADRAFGNSFAV